MEKETKAILLLIFGLILLVGNLIFLSSYSLITGKVLYNFPAKQYSYTKAICEKNVCQDYEFACKNSSLIYQKPVTEKVYFPEDWKDPRSKENISKLC